MRQYYVRAGTRRVTASFRYQAPVGAGLLGAVEGKPLSLEHCFVAGREYLALYREHPPQRSRASGLVDAIAPAGSPTGDGFWSLHIVDLSEVETDSQPRIERAQLYGALMRVRDTTRSGY